MNKKNSWITFVIWFYAFSSVSAASPENQNTMVESPIKEINHKYGGGKYRSPFALSQKSTEGGSINLNFRTKPGEIQIEPESLKVTGVILGDKGKYAILSGSADFYIVRDGRLFSYDEVEIPGIAAVIKDKVVILITDDNTTYELPIPQ